MGGGRVEEGEGKTDTYRSSTAGKDGYGYHFTGDNFAGIWLSIRLRLEWGSNRIYKP